jgi:methanogenic corrinoid protein MtbC1/DNA-binding XRE family transcriptional regulator
MPRRSRPLQARRYTEALLAGDQTTARRLIDGLLESGVAGRDIYLTVLTPALQQIGALWCSGDINVADEHLATEMTLAQMERLRPRFTAPSRAPRRALIACAQGEDHLVGARMAADFFMLDGWRVDFLGGDVPTESLVRMVNKRCPDVVGLSVTMKQNLKHAWSAVEQMAGLGMPPKIILSGRAVVEGPLKRTAKRYCAVAANADEGVTLARDLFGTESPKAVLQEYLSELGRRIRELRAHKGWTQQHLAVATRLTRAYIVAVEGGKQNVTLDVVVRIANALAVGPEQLLGGPQQSGARRENSFEAS